MSLALSFLGLVLAMVEARPTQPVGCGSVFVRKKDAVGSVFTVVTFASSEILRVLTTETVGTRIGQSLVIFKQKPERYVRWESPLYCIRVRVIKCLSVPNVCVSVHVNGCDCFVSGTAIVPY
jgi:hypothetical protein